MKGFRRIFGLAIIFGFVFFYLLAFNNCGKRFESKITIPSKSPPDDGTEVTNPDPFSGPDSTGPTPLNPTFTYSEHIKPIIQSRCSQCHQQNGIAPFALSQYTQVKDWGKSILSRVKARIMPPWGAQDDGSCQSFHNSLWMSDKEISTLQTWVDEKFPEGTPTSDILPDSPPEHYNLGSSDVVEFKMPSLYTPVPGVPLDDYRCFITNDFPSEHTIVGFDVMPSNPEVVHHVIAYMPKTESDESIALSKGQGYSCFGGSGVASSVVAFWAPGTGITPYPQFIDPLNDTLPSKQTGLKIPSGRKLILQVHYNYLSGKQSDQTSVRFKTSSSNVKEGSWLQFGKVSGVEVIPKATYEYTHTENSQVGRALNGSNASVSVPGFLYAVFPHMHQVGSKINIEVNRSVIPGESFSSNECLVNVPAWDFHWQRIYWFKKPVPVNVLDNLKMSCTYNTLNKSTDTRFGEGSDDEMCFMFGFVTDANL